MTAATTILEISCRDPIVARDGRPFGQGQCNRMRSVDWPLPSMVAGSLRTAVGKSAGRNFGPTEQAELLQLEVGGPFPAVCGQLYFPAPEDCVVHDKSGPLRAVPQVIGPAGCDLPEGLRPVGLTVDDAPEDFKPTAKPAWWPEERMAAWLAGEKVALGRNFLDAAPIESRTHVRVDPEVGAAEDGELFSTAALTLSHLPRFREAESVEASHPRGIPTATFAEIILMVRARAGGWCEDTVQGLDILHPLGGERRLAHWRATAGAPAWTCPQCVGAALADAPRVRMVLATPAIFAGGWKPAWLNDKLVGTPPGAAVRLRLVGVSIQRWRAVSGWSLASPRGPKPVRRMVAAGGVYFFEIAEGNAGTLAVRWLESVSDDGQAQRDGFGLALWGIW